MADQNAVIQIIVQQPGGAAFERMCAGTGWFPDTQQNNVPEGTILTNAHVIRNAKDVFIRLPAAHKQDIRAHVQGMSGDLDLAVIKLKPEALQQVKNILKERYGDDTIPTLKLADSDSIHPKLYKNPRRSAIYARGYPLGNEYQCTTQGIVSSLKHTRNQVYIVTTATINSGNSGGPAVNEEGDVVGINSMKLVSKGVEEINMIIPSNRIKRTLPMLLDNSKKANFIHDALAKILFQKALMKLGKTVPSNEQISAVNKLMEPLKDIDYTKVVSNWNQHNVGGFKRVSGIVAPVTISDWFQKHVHNNHGGHELFEKVFTALHEDDIDKVTEMRKIGFKNYYCMDCSSGLKCGEEADKIMEKMEVPPATVHMPNFGFQYSHSTGAPTLAYYGNPKGVKSGVIMAEITPMSVFHESGVKKGDLLVAIDNESVDNYGEVWCSKLGVSLNIVDVLCRGASKMSLVSKDGELREVDIVTKHDPLPIRFLDAVLDPPPKVINFKGIQLKVLRLDDVLKHNIKQYMDPATHHLQKIVVADIDSRSAAYQAKSIRPGDILKAINGQTVSTDSPSSPLENIVSTLKADNVMLEMESGHIICI